MNEIRKKRTAVIAGAGQMGRAAAELLSSNNIKLLAFADNSEEAWGKRIYDVPVMSVTEALALEPDVVIVSVLGEDRSEALCMQVRNLVHGDAGKIIKLRELYDTFDIRSRCIHSLADRINDLKIPGAAAELGVYRGDTAWQINDLLPDRKLYLFDTFQGFDQRDLEKESQKGHRDFSDTSAEGVLERMPYPEKCIIKKGYFPETAEELENESFAFVSLDPDLYAPVISGLEFFYPRLSKGGVILVHDYDNKQFVGVRKAVDEFEREMIRRGDGPLCLVPLGDLHGSCVITKK